MHKKTDLFQGEKKSKLSRKENFMMYKNEFILCIV